MPYHLVIYENGRRYYQALTVPLEERQDDDIIFSDSLRVSAKIYNDGAFFTSMLQKISNEEAQAYRDNPDTFTAKVIF